MSVEEQWCYEMILFMVNTTANTFSSALFCWINVGMENVHEWIACNECAWSFLSTRHTVAGVPYIIGTCWKYVKWRNKWYACNEP